LKVRKARETDRDYKTKMSVVAHLRCNAICWQN